MAKYFGTNGVRGKFDLLNPKLATEIAYAVGTYFSSGKILIARDHRLTSDVLHDAVVYGLEAAGCSIIDLGLIPAPTAEFMIKPMAADGLMIITASHNPPEWNGLKVVDGNGITISKERGEQIEKIMEKQDKFTSAKQKKLQKYEKAIQQHTQATLSYLGTEKINKIKQKKLRLVLDFGNGTTALFAQLFSKLGCELITLNAHMDGRFPGRPSEPTETNVQDLIAAVKATESNAGIAWDGDGDRVIFVDNEGKYVVGDRVFALSLLWQLEKKKGSIVTTVATSKVVEDVAKNSGVQLYYSKIGAPYLSEMLVEKNAIMAGEEVGGVIWPELSLAKDGITTAAKLCEALRDKPLSQWLKELPVYYNEKTKIPAGEKEKIKVIIAILSHAKKNKSNFIDIDGVRINFEDSWVIVRASGTENYIRIFAEAKTQEKAKKLLNDYIALVKSWL